MKDYSKVKYVKPSVDGLDITKGKVYEVYSSKRWGWPSIDDDADYDIAINIIDYCFHLNNHKWIPCDKDGNEIEI